MMLKRLVALGAAAAMYAFVAPTPASAQGMQMHKPSGAKQTINGTVVDVSCKFGLGLSGADHRMCAQVCADRGVALAILGSDGKLYFPTTEAMPGEGQNGRLKEFAEQQVRVTGTVFTAGGANAIWIETIAKT